MAEKTAEKPAGGKLVLFNHGRNPIHLKDGPPYEKVDGKDTTRGIKRIFAVGDQIECIDQAEYDMLKNYKGIATSQQVAPSLQGLIIKLESEKVSLTQEVEGLRKQLEKFQDKKGK